MEIKYSPADLVDDWADKWLDLIDLINRCTGTDEASQWPPPPTVFDELQYNSLRSWLLSHQEQFLPLWKAFFQNHYIGFKTSKVGKDSDFPQKYNDNPFMYFYEPENLYRLAWQLELQSGIDIWLPSENVASQIRPLLTRLGKMMIEFMDWIAINDSCKEACMFNGRMEILQLNIILDKLSHTRMDYYFKAFEREALPDPDQGYNDETSKVLANLAVMKNEIMKIKDQCDIALKLIDELGNQMH